MRGTVDHPLEYVASGEIGTRFPSTVWVPERGTPLSVAPLESTAWGATVAVGLDDGRVVRLRVELPGAKPRAGSIVESLGGPIVGLAEDIDGRLWVLTPASLWRIDPPGAEPFEVNPGIRADTVAPAPPSNRRP